MNGEGLGSTRVHLFIKVSQIVLHEADQPDLVIDLANANEDDGDLASGIYRTKIDEADELYVGSYSGGFFEEPTEDTK